jgi:hypothetical protein
MAALMPLVDSGAATVCGATVMQMPAPLTCSAWATPASSARTLIAAMSPSKLWRHAAGPTARAAAQNGQIRAAS